MINFKLFQQKFSQPVRQPPAPFKWTDKFEQSFLNPLAYLLSTQQMLHCLSWALAGWICTLQTSMADFQEEDKRLCTKLTDLKKESGVTNFFYSSWFEL